MNKQALHWLLAASLLVGMACRAQSLSIAVIDKGMRLEAVARAIMSEAYRRAGVQVNFREVPAVRALYEANEGKLDGELQRIGGLSVRFPALIQVNVPIHSFDAIVLARDPALVVRDWNSLKPYKIGFHRGIVIFENRTKGMRVDEAPTNELVLRKLQKGRTDLALMPEAEARQLLARMPGHGLHILSPPIEKVQLYHYLHKKHAALVPKLEAILKGMQADGSLAALGAH